jgi:MFS transporter, ACS family, DAL5 transporter family protein
VESSQLNTIHKPKAEELEYDAAYKKRLARKIDIHIMPLCAFLYLLKYLDRSNIGNGKILNQETGDSFLGKTSMTTADYSLVLTVFGIAYSTFDIPFKFIMKRFIKPSHWLGLLMFYWGVLTLTFAFVKNSSTIIWLRFLIGAVEAGFFPGHLRRPFFQFSSKAVSHHRRSAQALLSHPLLKLLSHVTALHFSDKSRSSD